MGRSQSRERRGARGVLELRCDGGGPGGRGGSGGSGGRR